MIWVVLDTHVVVSANLREGGLPHAVFNLAINGVIQLQNYWDSDRAATVRERYFEILNARRQLLPISLSPEIVRTFPTIGREPGLSRAASFLN